LARCCKITTIDLVVDNLWIIGVVVFWRRYALSYGYTASLTGRYRSKYGNDRGLTLILTLILNQFPISYKPLIHKAFF
jgi:hypothetical protein